MQLRGSIAALVTPMRAGEAPATPLDEEAMARLVAWHIEQGTSAIVIAGTTGESATLEPDEHCALIGRSVEWAAGQLPVIAGTGANSTTEAIDLTRCAQRAGADACLLVTPYYNKPTQEGLYRHYRTIAEEVAIPQILYNVPGRTACDMLPETIARLARIENIVGVKEASADMERVERLRATCGEEFALFSGDDATAGEFMLRGGQGVVSVTANVAPRAMQTLCRAAASGDRAATAGADASLTKLHAALFLEPNPIPVKWALHRIGRIEPGIRLPLTWMSADHESALLEAMRAAAIKV